MTYASVYNASLLAHMTANQLSEQEAFPVFVVDAETMTSFRASLSFAALRRRAATLDEQGDTYPRVGRGSPPRPLHTVR